MKPAKPLIIEFGCIGSHVFECEAWIGEILDIRLPYWVSPDVVHAIENGICAGEVAGEVKGIDDEYIWKLRR